MLTWVLGPVGGQLARGIADLWLRTTDDSSNLGGEQGMARPHCPAWILRV